MMMIKAGEPVDWTIDLLKPHLQEGDIIIDGGNSNFQDSQEEGKSIWQLRTFVSSARVSPGVKVEPCWVPH